IFITTIIILLFQAEDGIRCRNVTGFQTCALPIFEAKDLDLFLLAVTDILNSNSEVLALGKASENVEKAFDVQLAANRALLEGVVSRKKQIVTKLGATF